MSYGGGVQGRRGGDGGEDTDYMARAETQPQQMIEGGQPLPGQKYKFSPEEIRVLKECNRESFYYRSLPLGTFLGVGAFYAVRGGYLKPSARWGAGPKMFVGSILGYFIGKISYQPKCIEKIMRIPNSPLAEMLRKQKGKIGFQETLNLEPGFISAATGSGYSDAEVRPQQPGLFTDVGDTQPMTSFDSETSSLAGEDYDTTQQMMDDDNLPPKRPQQYTTSYDELRKQNRDDFERKIHSPPTQSSPPRSAIDMSNQAANNPYQYPLRDPGNTTGPRQRKNAYGDVLDDKQQ